MADILTVTSPYDRHFIAEFPLAGEQEVEEILDRAHRLFQDNSRHLARFQRIEILERLITLMTADVEKLTHIAAEEGGKPYKDSKVEVLRAINGVRIAIAELYHLGGKEIPMGMTPASVGRMAFTTREPIGVIMAISAFNHPLNLIIHQVIPAIAAGCPVIVKPASSTPVSCFNLVNMLYDAGLPKEWCTAVVCNRKIAEKMAADRRIAYLTFIGSHAVGWKLRSILAPGTRVALEHGGVAPVIVDETASLSEIVPSIAKGGFYHAGQVCVSVQKVFAHESIANDLAIMLAGEADRMIVGDPLDPGTDIGPMIAENEVQRIKEWVDEAVKAGAGVVNSKFQAPDSKQIQSLNIKNQNLIQHSTFNIQHFLPSYRPTVLFSAPEHLRVSREEIFGPVICVYPYSQLDDAISRANSLRYAFQASIFTKNIDAALQAARKINASSVMINDHTAFRVDWMPFGGRDESGIGMGGIPYSMHEMTRSKLIVFNY